MTERKRKSEISKHPLSRTSMSTCCHILEILAERESMGKVPVVSLEEVLADYNNKRIELGKRTSKEPHFKNQINFLKTLGFIDNSSLTETGRRIASHCAGGSHDLYVSIIFFREIYRRVPTFRDLIAKIREGRYSSVAESIEDSARSHGFNDTLKDHLRKWIEELDMISTEGGTIRINRFFESKALESVSINDVLQFIDAFKDEWDSIQESNLYSDLDKEVFCGTQSVATMRKVIDKLAEKGYITINHGKYNTNFILRNKLNPARDISIQHFLNSN